MIDFSDYDDVDVAVAERLIRLADDEITVWVDSYFATAVPLEDDWLVFEDSSRGDRQAARMPRDDFFEAFVSVHKRGDGSYRNYIYREGPGLGRKGREDCDRRVGEAEDKVVNGDEHFPMYDW